MRIVVALATTAALVFALEKFVLRHPAHALSRPGERATGAGLNQYIRLEPPRNADRITRPEPGLPGITGTNRYTTDAYGFRGDGLVVPKPEGEFRIFVVGGSTTECFYVDDDDTLTAVLQDELEPRAARGSSIKVYNAGRSGAASDDHIAMIGLRLVHLEPDMIVVFCGINDVRRSWFQVDPLHFVADEPAGKKAPTCNLLWHSQGYLRLRRLMTSWRTDDEVMEEVGKVSNYRRKVAIHDGLRLVDERPQVDPVPYRANLATIVGMARAHGFQLVFMTQQTTWNSSVDPQAREWHHMRGRTGGEKYREVHAAAAMESFNAVTVQLAEEQGIPLFETRTISKSLEYFYDDCHFNTKGSLTAGRGLAELLLAEKLVPLASTRAGQEQ